jgi:AcrR family transcriptional regulator
MARRLRPEGSRSRRTARAGAAVDEARRGPGRPVGATGDLTRQRVVGAALQTFAEQGFAGTSVRDIARKARIRVSSLYHYFPSKEALYEEVHRKMQEEMRELILSVMSKGLELKAMAREATGRFFDFLLANPAYVRLGFRSRLEGGVLFDRRTTDRWLGFMEGLMKPAEMQGLMKAVDPVLFLVTVDALVHWHAGNDAFYRRVLGKGLEDPEVARRAREHVIEVVTRIVGLD